VVARVWDVRPVHHFCPWRPFGIRGEFPLAFSGFRNHLGPLAKIGNVLSSSVGESLGLGSALGLPIAIEFGTGSLKVLQVVEGDPPALVAAASLETPEELVADHRKRLEFQIEGLPRLIKHGGFKGKRAVCAIPAWQTMCKHVSLARAEGMTVAAQVKEAIPAQFGRDPSTVVYRYFEVPTDKAGKVEAIVTAVPCELVEMLMKAISACKLEPVGMHSEFTAVLRTFDHVHRRVADISQNTLYLDIGATTTKVMISHGKDLAFARVIAMGGRRLDEVLAKQLKCDLGEARRMRLAAEGAFCAKPAKVEPAKELVAVGAVAAGENRRAEDASAPRAPGLTPDLLTQPVVAAAPMGASLTEPLEMLTDEVLMCLRYHESQFPGKKVERAMFVGGEARHKGLCQAIARQLRLQSQMADPLARVARSGAEPALGVDLKNAQPGWAVALGLCLSPTDL
jgi:type IV pilus assembly protein PilM